MLMEVGDEQEWTCRLGDVMTVERRRDLPGVQTPPKDGRFCGLDMGQKPFFFCFTSLRGEIGTRDVSGCCS